MSPAKIRVKLVSEAAEYVSITHVVQRDFSLAELVETMLPVLGKDAQRIRQILSAGTLSTGEYRYRWDPLEVEEPEIEALLGSFPGPEPSRAFQPESCFLVRFRRGNETLDLPRENAARKPLFARQSFWEGLLGIAGEGVRYADYSYGDRADIFALPLDGEMTERLRGLLPLLKPKSAAERLECFRPERIEWLSRR
ncbi:MAG: hypothetical protein ACRD88_19290 [Terriglobia bacterium]